MTDRSKMSVKMYVYGLSMIRVGTVYIVLAALRFVLYIYGSNSTKINTVYCPSEIRVNSMVILGYQATSQVQYDLMISAWYVPALYLHIEYNIKYQKVAQSLTLKWNQDHGFKVTDSDVYLIDCSRPSSHAVISDNTLHCHNVGSMLAHRLRRWANIEPTLHTMITSILLTVCRLLFHAMITLTTDHLTWRLVSMHNNQLQYH